eukprot:TRINITY_DN103060_c0_g1_i1.p1 TRINITY_DN103060_c0_g1~~TRINITY_DN103060_c0_g1_i1.p1  ORF type:complete len:143 (+),score=21.27 TRINITY_DN103060_c0_g1_i1:69-497(+)
MALEFPPSGIYKGVFTDVLDQPQEVEGGLTSDGWQRLTSYDSQDSYHSRTCYTLKIEDLGMISMSRSAENDCVPSLDEFDSVEGQLVPTGSSGSFDIVFNGVVQEKMQLAVGEDGTLKLRSMVEGAGPGAAPFAQEIALSQQ